ncbi:hypothetical protein [Corynebacterium accolens]|uniref:hypothetical protein n=1 Tax=Corynebacterium accolens TaxID=38284 RepID=UPI00266F36DC|nr:hypothetical protein [Corynebacterium accolens]WKS54923.1 hypothetical protein NLL31_06740 [Corynebacterium accolens]
MNTLDTLIFASIVGIFIVGFPVLLLAQTFILLGWFAVPMIALSVGAGVFIWHLLRNVEREC